MKVRLYHIHIQRAAFLVVDVVLKKINLLFLFFRFYLFTFRWGRKGERERNISVWLPLVHPQLGTWPAPQACALTGNPTGDLSVLRGAQSTEPHQPELIYL